MTNPQYAPGDLVRVLASTAHHNSDLGGRHLALIGKICEVRQMDEDGDISVWSSDKSDWFYFNPSDLEPATPPDEIEQHGVTYVRKDRVEADTARLDWLAAKPGLVLGFTLRQGWTVMQSSADRTWSGETPGAAIDAAMRAEQEAAHD